jgi:SAM-dependent methyltransferase
VICRWEGPGWWGTAHCESATCPGCGSIARDRFLFWCFLADAPRPRARVLETSPRLDVRYRRAMGRWFRYRACDFDERSHRADVHLDLQHLELRSRSIDVLLTAHVLEHVPDTERALAEIHRVLVPGGAMYLQVPVLQGVTAPPAQPEFHGDDTPVFWRFGYDLTDRLRAHGFDAALLVPEAWAALVAGAPAPPAGTVAAEFDVASMLAGAQLRDLRVVATGDEAERIGAEPAYMFCTWRCVKR